MFLRDFAFDGLELLTGCTAVTSLEQLEQEVAGVLSDCGDMERCVGALRRRDNHKAVAGRYSLGVTDSVMATERRHVTHCALHESPIVDDASLSLSAAAVRDSGYMWDDDGLGVELSTSAAGASERRRLTRSLSPQPAGNQRRSRKNCSTHSGVGVPIAAELFDGEPSPVTAAGSVSRRLSGRLPLVQHSQQ